MILDDIKDWDIDDYLENLREAGYQEIDSVLGGKNKDNYVLPLYMMIDINNPDEIDLYCFDSDQELMDFYHDYPKGLTMEQAGEVSGMV